MSHHIRKSSTGICENKGQISYAITAQLISVFVFATQIVQFLFYLNRNFKHLACFCELKGWFVSDLVGTQIIIVLLR